MAKRKSRGGQKRGSKKDNRPIQDIVKTQIMLRFTLDSLILEDIEALTIDVIDACANISPVALIELPDEYIETQIQAAATLAMRLRNQGMAVVIDEKYCENFPYFDGVNLLDFALHPPQNEDEEAPRASKVPEIEELQEHLSEEEYFGFGPTESLEKALVASEMGAAYIWLNDDSEDYAMVHWWSEMVEVPSVVQFKNEEELKNIAMAGADFALFSIENIKKEFSAEAINHFDTLCQEIYAIRSAPQPTESSD